MGVLAAQALAAKYRSGPMKFEWPVLVPSMPIGLPLLEPTLWAKVFGACSTPIAHRGGLLQKSDPLHAVQNFK
jgi:hypothetical protein